MSEKTTDFEGWAASHRGHFERRAKLVFKAVKLRVKEPALIKLYDAMEYALLGGGKRVRALLVYAAGDVTEAPQEVLTDIALAIEAIHAYSLVHDDLPCMDNDTLRRGKPTCHVAFGEAQALLAGDAPAAFCIFHSRQPRHCRRTESRHHRGTRACGGLGRNVRRTDD